MSLRKPRLANRDLLWIIGTPACGTSCMDCRDHLARVQIMRRTKRAGSAYSMGSRSLLHLCETCSLRFVEQLVGMLAHMTRNRVDDDLSFTTAERSKIDRDAGESDRHDRRVRARIRRLRRGDDALTPPKRVQKGA